MSGTWRGWVLLLLTRWVWGRRMTCSIFVLHAGGQTGSGSRQRCSRGAATEWRRRGSCFLQGDASWWRRRDAASFRAHCRGIVSDAIVCGASVSRFNIAIPAWVLSFQHVHPVLQAYFVRRTCSASIDLLLLAVLLFSILAKVIELLIEVLTPVVPRHVGWSRYGDQCVRCGDERCCTTD